MGHLLSGKGAEKGREGKKGGEGMRDLWGGRGIIYFSVRSGYASPALQLSVTDFSFRGSAALLICNRIARYEPSSGLLESVEEIKRRNNREDDK